MVVGCPIYMYRISGQMKLLVDRIYSLYANRADGGYDSMVQQGKRYALAISQGDPNPDQYKKSILYLAGMTGSGLGMEEVGLITHTDSQNHPADGDKGLLEKAFEIGCRLLK